MINNETYRSEMASTENTMTDHKQIAQKFLEMVIAGDIDEAYLKFVSMGGQHHNPYFRAGFPALREAMIEDHVKFPDKQFAVKKVIGEGDVVAVHSQLKVRQEKKEMAVMHIFRFQGDKIVEMWDMGQPIPPDSPNSDGAF